MTSTGKDRRRAVVGLLAATGAALATPLLAERAPRGTGPLDGRDYAGTLVPEDGGRLIDDSLHFREGYFWSRGCIACNFAPGPYWVRSADDTIWFRGLLESVTSGAFEYRGLVRNGMIEARIGWERIRWYWTLNRTFLFSGAASDERMDPNTLEGAFKRSLGERADFCTL